jgi:1-acyl-sn-glycerol-3-phosphate acyltransferase
MEANAPILEARRAKSAQRVPGMFCWLTTVAPFMRRVHGFEKMRQEQRCLFVSNHVSLLDAVMLGGLFTRHGQGPLLILADKQVWDASLIRRWLSGHFGFLMERGKFNSARVKELQAFGRATAGYHLLVFPEGTRGNGVDVAECQPGIFHIAQAACAPIVPIFIENMQFLSTKMGPFHFFGGWKKVEIHFGEAIAPAEYLSLTREELTDFLRKKIGEARSAPGGR